MLPGHVGGLPLDAGRRVIGTWVTALRLALATLGLGDVRVSDAVPFAIAAVELCEDPALCAAIAWGESRLRADVINPRTGTRGVMQTSGGRPRILTARAGVAEGVRKLGQAEAFCSRRGTTGNLCVLAGYRSGPAGVRGRWYRGPRAVLRRAARIRRAMAPIGGVA